MAAPTFFGSASNPADNGTGITAPVVITPPGSMQAGDLCFVTVCFSGTSGTLTVSADGGQTWTSLTTRNQTRNRARSFWCVFNGTWGANPSWTGSGTSNVIARMLVFRPDGGTASSWAVDVAESSATYTAPTTPFTVTNAGVTASTSPIVVIAGWTSADDNTWGTLYDPNSEGWVLTSPSQVRNTSTSYQQSVAHAYLITTHSGGQGSVSLNQATLGGDAGTRIIMAFRETRPVTVVPSPITAEYSPLESAESGGALKIPDPILATASEPVPTVSGAGLVEGLSPIEGTFAPLTPTPSVWIGPVPSPIAVTADQLTPTVLGSAVKVFDPILAEGSQPALAVNIGHTDTPEPILGTFSVLGLTPTGAVTNVPEPVTAQASQLTPTESGTAVVALGPITAIGSAAPTPTLKQTTLLVVAEQAAQASQVAPTAGVQGPTIVTPEPITATADQPALSLFARCLIVIQSAIEGLFSQLAPVLAGTLLLVPVPIMAESSQPPPAIYASAVVTPAPIEATASQVDPTMAGNVTVTPLPISGTFTPANVPTLRLDTIEVPVPIEGTASQPAPIILTGGSTTILASPIEGQASQPEATIQAGATVAPIPITGTFSQPTATVAGILNLSVTPDPIVGAFDQPAPALAGGATIVPPPIVGTFAQLSPTMMGNILITPDPITPTASQVTPTVKASAVIVPAPITATFAPLTPTLATGGNITVVPASIAGQFAPPTTVTLKLETTLVLTPITGTFSTPAPLVWIESVTVIPTPITGTFSQVAPTVSAQIVTGLNPLPILGAFSLPTPTVITISPGIIVPNPITGTLSVAGNPTCKRATLVVPAPITAQTSQLAPFLNADIHTVTVAPAPITARGQLPFWTSSIDTELVPVEVAGAFSQPAPTVLIIGSKIVAVIPLAGEFSQPTPVILTGGGLTITPNPITGTFSTLTPDAKREKLVTPDPIDAEVSAVAPNIAIGGVASVIVEPDAIDGEASLFAPSLAAEESPTVIPGIITIEASLPEPVVSLPIIVEVEPIAATAGLADPAPLFNSALVVPVPVTAIVSLPTPSVRASGERWLHPVLKDVFGRQRMFDSMRVDPMQDAAERDRIIDIYLGRK